jgi:peptidoglycan/xylan/chitin deacetylase (PgdA/CDA1 family)
MLTFLAHEGIPVVTLHEALTRAAQGDGNCVCFTFDDGYRDNFEVALPIFQRFNAPFTVFLTTGFINRTATMWWSLVEEVLRENTEVFLHHRDGGLTLPTGTIALKRSAFKVLHGLFIAASASERERMAAQLADRYGADLLARHRNHAITWDMAREMVASGLVEFGCHTVTHPMMSRLSDIELYDEVVASASEIERKTGRAPILLAYPYGNLGAREMVLTEKLGFSAAVTTRPQVLTPATPHTPFAIPRVSLDGHYQALRYIKLFLSGLPFMLGRLAPS